MNWKGFIQFVLIGVVIGVIVGLATKRNKPAEPNLARYVIEAKDCVIVVKEHTVRVECKI